MNRQDRPLRNGPKVSSSLLKKATQMVYSLNLIAWDETVVLYYILFGYLNMHFGNGKWLCTLMIRKLCHHIPQ